MTRMDQTAEEQKEKEEQELENDTPQNQYLIFSVDNESFGIDINYVIEIIGMEMITTVPDLQKYMKGVINLRGKVIPVMDVRLRLHKPEKEYNDRTCIIVVEINTIYMGLIIDEVLEVINIERENIMPPPKNGREKENITNRYIWGIIKINNTVKLLLDGEKLLEKTE